MKGNRMATKPKYAKGDKVVIKKQYAEGYKDRQGTILDVDRGPRGMEYFVRFRLGRGTESLWYTARALKPKQDD